MKFISIELQIIFILVIVLIIILIAQTNERLYSGFANNVSEVIVDLRQYYDYEIVPALKCFLDNYDQSDTLKKEYKIKNDSRGVPSDSDQKDLKKFLNNILTRVNTRKIYQTSGSKDTTSYTINKGEEIYICAQDTNGNPHSLDVVKFVFLHELVHVGSEQWGHEERFWAEFRFLMYLLCNYSCNSHDHKTRFKYCSIDFANRQNQENYCGMVINYNPLFDDQALTYTN